MISSVVGGDLLKGVPRESVAAMVIDRLDRGHGEKPHALTVAHASCEVRDARASSIEQESFDGMVIQSTKSIRDIEAMMSGMEFHFGRLLELSLAAKEKGFTAYRITSGSNAWHGARNTARYPRRKLPKQTAGTGQSTSR